MAKFFETWDPRRKMITEVYRDEKKRLKNNWVD